MLGFDELWLSWGFHKYILLSFIWLFALWPSICDNNKKTQKIEASFQNKTPFQQHT